MAPLEYEILRTKCVRPTNKYVHPEHKYFRWRCLSLGCEFGIGRRGTVGEERGVAALSRVRVFF